MLKSMHAASINTPHNCYYESAPTIYALWSTSLRAQPTPVNMLPHKIILDCDRGQDDAVRLLLVLIIIGLMITGLS